MKRGLYRIRGTGGRPDDIRVDDDGIEVPMEEHLYRARGHLPPVDDLPWSESYLTPKPSGEGASTANESTAKTSRERDRQDFLRRFSKS